MKTDIFKNLLGLPKFSLTSGTVKIAITGLSHAGKTVFITSLIDSFYIKIKFSA